MDQAKAFRQFFFKPDGTAEVRSRIHGAPAETVEQFSDVDVSDHWVDRVTWGDWDRIGPHQPEGTGPGLVSDRRVRRSRPPGAAA